MRFNLNCIYGTGAAVFAYQNAACKIYNSVMQVLAGKTIKGLDLLMSTEMTQVCCPEFFPRRLPSGKTFGNYKSDVDSKELERYVSVYTI